MAQIDSITSKTSILTLTASDPSVNDTLANEIGLGNNGYFQAASSIIGVPFQVRGLASLSSMTSETTTLTEWRVTMDDDLLAGYVPGSNLVRLTMNVEPVSASRKWFGLLHSYMEARREGLVFAGTLLIPSNGTKYTFKKGAWLQWQPFPSHSTTLQSMSYSFIFQISGIDGVLNA